MTLANKTQSPYRKWLVAIGCFLMVFLGMGFCSSTKGLFLGAITKDLEIPRDMFSLQDTFRFAVTAIANIFFGTLLAKFGPRIIAAAGFMCFAGYLTISIYTDQVVMFYIAGCLLGIATSFCSTAMVSYMVNLWFPEKRGTVSGAIMCANGIGGAIATQLLDPIIKAQAFGYRNAFMLSLVITLITGVAVVLLVAKPKGATGTVAKKKARGAMWSGITYKEALRKPYFYAAIFCVLLTGMALQGIHGIAKTHMDDAGVSDAKNVMSICSLVLTGSKFLSGFSYDKLGLRRTILICELCAVGGFTCLAFCGAGSFGYVMAVTFAVLSALSLPLETVMIPLITADLFGEKDFSKLLGYFVAANYTGYAIGGYVFNRFQVMTGSYVGILLAAAVMMGAIIVGFQFILSAANRTRKQVESQQSTQ